LPLLLTGKWLLFEGLPVFNLNETIFLVGSYAFNSTSSTDDVSQLWINPDPSDFGSSVPPGGALFAAAGPDINANQIASFVFLQAGLGSTNEPATIIADELRIGTTWASVTPRGIMPPRLNIARAGAKSILSWPLTAPEYTLQIATVVGATNTWTTASSPVLILGDQFITTNTASAASTFYRLRK
jgi:hypothetical protein